MAASQSTIPSSLPNIPVKLDGSNYYYWKSIMIPVLKAYRLLGYVDGTLASPPETIAGDDQVKKSNPEYETWMVQDQIALTILMLSVSQEVGCNLVGLTSSHQVWTTLATLFDSHTIAQEDFIEQQWRDIKKGDTPMIEYLKNVKQLATQFSLIGKPITPLQLNRRITTGLGTDWEPLVLALAPSLSTMNTNDLSALLLNQEARRKYAASIEMTPPLSGLLGPTPATANL
uniref:Uncharacterized protein n=1 Tax=Ananas comosus var. bracteatus TaxID=296719 RepID=A0A6V7QRN4_ANACO